MSAAPFRPAWASPCGAASRASLQACQHTRNQPTRKIELLQDPTAIAYSPPSEAETDRSAGRDLRNVIVSLLAAHDEIVEAAHDRGYSGAIDVDDGRTGALLEEFAAVLAAATTDEVVRVSARAQAQAAAALAYGAHYLKVTWDTVVRECQWHLAQAAGR